MTKSCFWLHCENKEFERRAALTPTTSKKLIDAVFDDSEYEIVGCKLVDNNTWPSAPVNIPIIGLKELLVSTDPLSHTHIQFSHCYKQQAGWIDVLSRFQRGGGALYDLEFLNDANGRRVAAFGYHAGFAGAAAGALAVASQRKGEKLGLFKPFENEGAMISAIKAALGGSGKGVKALVIGALGRCGRGAVDLFRKVGVDEYETAKGGPFPEILDVDIFVNCIYLSSEIPSCDTTNPFNPIPIYTINTTFSLPTVPIDVGTSNPLLSVISIDHLPTLLPREASEQFSSDLLPSLLQFPDRDTARVWTEAKALFDKKVTEAVEATKP
ncbi:hypothetical protein DFS33DRAFT_1373248 [Desarmillaria ectypa]|nr:hypothetical protein DFS33DRAFT_1373248 [Desarmillaria ectypa]